MNVLSVELNNCYGIGHFQYDFDFSVPSGPHRHSSASHSQTNILYAHNGVMKTSFAKTFDDIAHGQLPVDRAYGRTPHYRIDADGVPLDPGAIFVVRADGEYFETEKMATLLADKPRQQRYATIMEDINTAVEQLFKHVAAAMGIPRVAEVTKRFDAHFGTSDSTRLNKLISLQSDVEKANLDFLRVDYRVIDDPKVAAFLDKQATHQMLRSYIETFEALMQQSKFFQDGVYDYTNAQNVQMAIQKNNFMADAVKNRVVLVDKEGKETTVSTPDDLEKAYAEDKNRIFSDLKLKVAYEKFDKEIGHNEQLRDFQRWIKRNQDLIPQLQTQDFLKTYTWHALLADAAELYTAAVDTYESNKTELNALYDESDKLQSRWEEVVEHFNTNFSVPFVVSVKNKKDVVLDRTKPVLEFTFSDGRGSSKSIDVRTLTSDVLSRGESRALFILSIMFEIESRIIDGGEHVVVLDDVADSFDYKNKYAIIEYLHSLSDESVNGIHLIVMTHNFDFYRAFRLRCWGKDQCKSRIATRDSGAAITMHAGGSINEFDRFKQEVARDEKVFLAMIPFARNLSEYTRGTAGNDDYQKMTSCLHRKSDTSAITVADVAAVLNSNIHGLNLTAFMTTEKYVDMLTRVLATIVNNPDESKLEDKIVLAIGIRMEAEKHMLGRFIADAKPYTTTPRSVQTACWFREYCGFYGVADLAVSVLKRVMIATPESIHLNSFMYEPIMDMSVDELIKLYTDVLSL